MCENNQYAISVPVKKQLGGKVSDRALGYGIPGVRVDGNDALEVYRVVKEARERAIRGEGATLIEAMMYRLSPHATSDNDLAYRTKEEIDENWKKDGIPKMKQYLIENDLWSEEQDGVLLQDIQQQLKEAIMYAEQAPLPKPEDTLLHVYASEGEV
ncbi:2-oxoisovalerate dehydrogenase subunit alpha [compost metagenome]